MWSPAKSVLLFVLISEGTLAATSNWVQLVDPLLTSAEKKAYLSLSAAEREQFEKNFWNNKTISSEEYFERVQYIDATFGSGKPGSGANTDQGRIYLGLGPPTKVTRLPSSRIFVPIEIWYYDTIPGVLQTEARLLFYQKNSLGFFKLYSPNVDTIRVLLLPEAATINMFGPNDTTDEAAIRSNLQVPPAEDEVITAAAGIATGVKDIGNDEILGRLSAPRAMLTRELTPGVRSRFIPGVPKLTSVLTRSPYGGMQTDLSIEVAARGIVKLEVFQREDEVYQDTIDLKLDAPRSAQYLHRLDLLPGPYRVMVSVDGNTFPYPLQVTGQPPAGNLFRASEARRGRDAAAPFEFEGRHFYPADDGAFVLWQLPQPGEVVWSIRRGLEVLWKSKAQEPGGIAVLSLPLDSLPPGKYQLEASSGDETKLLEFENAKSAESDSSGTLVSYNANLAPASRYTLIGEQWVLRGQLKEASRIFEKALNSAPLERTQIDLARVEALGGDWDKARALLRPILASEPKNFDALCIMAYVEAKLQDFEIASELYHRALEVHDSAAVRIALSQLHD